MCIRDSIDAVNFGDSVITDLSYFICEPYMDTSLQEKYLSLIHILVLQLVIIHIPVLRMVFTIHLIAIKTPLVLEMKLQVQLMEKVIVFH